MLSAIICTYNRAKYLRPLLESIAANTLQRDAYEILVVDNNCTDNTADICREFEKDHPQVRFRCVAEPEQGLSAARNRGIREAKGDILVYIDDDAIVDPDYLQAFAEWFAQHPRTMAAGGPIQPLYEEGGEPQWMSPYTRALLTAWMDYGEKPRRYPKGRYPGGGNAAYRKAVFERTGLFNTALGRKGGNLSGSEEKDIFQKMARADMEVMYIPTPVLHHSIPPAKLTKEYFDRLTLQIGRSERTRTKSIGGTAYLKRLLSELFKWAGTLVLALAYLVKCQPAKGSKLILFRRNVTRGLLGK